MSTGQHPNAGHRCAAVGCQHLVQPGFLMCVTHWRMVPAKLQRDVWTAWREFRRTSHRANPAALQLYRQAVQAAIDAVHAKGLARKATKDAGTSSLF